jgi:hypothetical protein
MDPDIASDFTNPTRSVGEEPHAANHRRTNENKHMEN